MVCEFKQCAGRGAKRSGQPLQIVYTNTGFTALHSAHVGPVQAAAFCQLLLAPAIQQA